MKRKDRDYFDLCKDLASRSGHSRFHHGSIVVYRRGRVLGRGNNNGKTHAEINSVKSIPKYFLYDNLSVYVCRINAQGHFMYSRPCDKCMSFMKRNGVCKVHFSDFVGFSKITL